MGSQSPLASKTPSLRTLAAVPQYQLPPPAGWESLEAPQNVDVQHHPWLATQPWGIKQHLQPKPRNELAAKGKAGLTPSLPKAGPFTHLSREQREVLGQALADLGADTDAHATAGYTYTHPRHPRHPLPKQRLKRLKNEERNPVQGLGGNHICALPRRPQCPTYFCSPELPALVPHLQQLQQDGSSSRCSCQSRAVQGWATNMRDLSLSQAGSDPHTPSPPPPRQGSRMGFFIPQKAKKKKKSSSNH